VYFIQFSRSGTGLENQSEKPDFFVGINNHKYVGKMGFSDALGGVGYCFNKNLSSGL
jgi:hypothetical protein